VTERFRGCERDRFLAGRWLADLDLCLRLRSREREAFRATCLRCAERERDGLFAFLRSRERLLRAARRRLRDLPRDLSEELRAI